MRIKKIGLMTGGIMISKEDYIQGQVEGSWEDWKFINQVLYDYFESQVKDMTDKQFKEHLIDLNWEVE